MKISAILGSHAPCYSFEFLPPKTADGEKQLWDTLEDLRGLTPDFVSVTYGAGGSTRDRTVDLVSQIKARTGIEAMAHLTCVGHTRDELAAILDRLAEAKVDNVLALRGDPPKGAQNFTVTTGGFAHASELVAFIKERGYAFGVGVAGYPEGHLESSKDDDLRHLKTKVDAGADFVITQLFFDNAFYFDFVQRARATGIAAPIVPGIMPVTNFEQVQRFVRMCGATVPMRLQLALEKIKDDPQAVMQLGVAHATLQCSELLSRGVPGLHFYTLNRSPAARMIVTALRARG